MEAEARPSLDAQLAIGDLTSSLSLKNLEHMLLAAQQQQLRQLRRLQQMKRQAELGAAMQAAWQEKQRIEDLRKQQRQEEAKKRVEERSTRSQRVEARRRAAADAAAEQQASLREQLQQKLDAADQRTAEVLQQRVMVSEYKRVISAKREARRSRNEVKRTEQEEARRAAILAKEAAVERHLKQRAELKALQEEIRREEEALGELHRASTRQRAEQEEAAKVDFYQRKAAAREKLRLQRLKEADLIRTMKAKEVQERFSYIKERAAAAAEADEHRRQTYAERLADKMARVEAVEEQRSVLMHEMQRIKKAMLEQESRMKEAMVKMERSGRWEFPSDLVQALHTFESTISSPYSSPRSQSPNGDSSSVWSPRIMAGNAGGSRPGSPLGPGSRSASPFRAGSPGGATFSSLNNSSGLLLSRAEAQLRKVLEEEISVEMQRELALQQAGTVEERKRLLKQFAQEREAAKRRLMSVGAALQQQALGNSISRGGSPGRPRSASAARQGSPGGSSKAPAAAQPAGSSAREGC